MEEHKDHIKEGEHRISVVIPVYNSEAYLEKCLDSVQASNFTDLEILCVDDGSTDRSMEILSSYAGADPRIRIFTQDHPYAGAARNAGIKAASVETRPSPGFPRQTRRLPLPVFSGGINARSLIFGYVVPWNKLFRRDFLIRNNICSLICGEDRSFYFDVIFKTDRIIRITDRLVRHRTSISTSMDGSDIRLRHFDVEFRSFELIWDIVKDAPADLKKNVLENCIHDSMFYYSRSIGTRYEQPIRKLLYNYWHPYFPMLGKSIRIR